MRLSPWAPGLEEAFIRFWNRCFASRRNFIPLTKERWRCRVTAGGIPGERFDPEDLIVAREGGEIAGFVHAGRRSAVVCRRHDPGWPGGTQGTLNFLFVDPAHRKKGLGSQLWHAALEHLKRTRQIILDGQCLNPYWGNSQGPRTPLWGTPEGVAVEWGDSATKKFLARKGFAPRFRAIQLARRLDEGPLPEGGEAVFIPWIPRLGGLYTEKRRLRAEAPVETAAVVSRGRVRGLLAYFPLAELRPGLYAIYEAAVVEAERGGSLGRRLLGAALGRLRERGALEIEVLTVPEVSEYAHRVYLEAGFTPVASWAIY